ncbi:MAG: thiamine pyrophosphate-dependent enzyme, partial [Planctomycetota bacterium]
EQLAAAIREVLAEGLPTSDLDALAEGLQLLGRADVDLGALSSKIDSVVTGAHIDGTRLARMVEIARGLADLEWHLAQGPTGLGRSRGSVVIAPGTVAQWAATFPFHAFQGPVLADAGGAAGPIARGLLEGQLRQVTAGLRVARLGRLELERPGEAAAAALGPPTLAYDQLTPEERQVCPPVLIIGDDQGLGGPDLSQLVWLLGSGHPVKVVILSDPASRADLGLGVDSLAPFPSAQRSDLALLGLMARDAFVVQTSLACERHFAQGVEAALAFDGPALIIVHAPSPKRHGFAPEHLLDQAQLAVQTRVVPLLTSDPAREGVFGARLDLSGNPQPEAAWLMDEDGRARTPADWAATEARFEEHLRPLDESDPRPVPVAAFLELSPEEQSGCTPFVEVESADGSRRLRVGPALVEDAADRLAIWRTLQELGGVVTPFTRQVQEKAAEATSASHRAEIDRIRAEHEARIAALRSEFAAEATEQVTDGLMALVNQGAAVLNGRDDEP